MTQNDPSAVERAEESLDAYVLASIESERRGGEWTAQMEAAERRAVHYCRAAGYEPEDDAELMRKNCKATQSEAAAAMRDHFRAWAKDAGKRDPWAFPIRAASKQRQAVGSAFVERALAETLRKLAELAQLGGGRDPFICCDLVAQEDLFEVQEKLAETMLAAAQILDAYGVGRRYACAELLADQMPYAFQLRTEGGDDAES